MTPILVPGRVLHAGRANRHPVVFAGLRYLQALWRAGATEMVVGPRPMEATAIEELVASVGGVLLLGGPDVDPSRYGEDPHETTYGIRADEDDFEIALVRAAVEAEVPVLAICRGMQVLNVALGGDLIQHLGEPPDVLARRPPGFPVTDPGAIGPLIPVELAPGCRLARAFAATQVVGAHMHHQALRRVAPGLTVTATATDGIIEAVEHERGWVVGVQWHPEDTADVDPDQQRLFDSFSTLAGRRWARADGTVG